MKIGLLAAEYFAVFALGGLGAFSLLLTSRRRLTRRGVGGSVLYSGCLSCAVVGYVWGSVIVDPVGPLWVALMVGLTNLKATDLAAAAWRKLGITIEIKPPRGKP